MLRRLGSRLHQASGPLALFLVLTGGIAYAANTIGSSDIINESILSEDIKNGQVRSADVANFNLNDEDVGQGTFVNFAASIGWVPANGCTYGLINGIDAQGDHLLLTPSAEDTAGKLIYNVQYRPNAQSAYLEACNVTNGGIDDGTSHFNLLVFDAQ